MEEAVQLSVQERSDTPEGANDFACLADVPSRLRVITMARRMPSIISQIPFDDDAIPTKPVLAVLLRNILKVPALQRTNAQICFIMCKYSSEGAAREWSTVVDISILPLSFKPVSL